MKNGLEERPTLVEQEGLVELNADNAKNAIILSEIINRKY